MKRGVVFPLLLGFLFFFNSLSAAELRAFFSHAAFYAPGKGPYIETYISFIGPSLQPLHSKDGKYGEVEITILFRHGDEVANYSKYLVKSPVVASDAQIPNFIDQQRFILPNGKYTLELTLADIKSPEDKFSYEEEITIDFNSEALIFSNIQLLESIKPSVKPNILTKSGYDLVPYVSDFYPADMDKLLFYNEIYNSEKIAGQDEKFLVNYYLEDVSTGQKVENYSSFSRKTAAPVVIILGEFPIQELPSGNYQLVIEARDKTNNLLGKTAAFFQRSNPSAVAEVSLENINIENTFAAQLPDDSINYYLQTLFPISTPAEQGFLKNQLRSEDKNIKLRYFYQFWYNRNQSSPETAWLQYREKLITVDNAYGTRSKAGFLTDRGYVYLKYGAPNTIVERPREPNSYPYEIWHYYKIGNLSNRRFIFYNRNLADDDYELLHSDMFGEINNPRWQYYLQQRNTPNLDPYDNSGRGGVGTDSEDLFNAPR